MGTVGRGRVLELWLLGPDVVVEPGEKLADTRAAEKSGKGKMLTYCDTKERGSKKRMCLTLAVVVNGVVVRRRP